MKTILVLTHQYVTLKMTMQFIGILRKSKIMNIFCRWLKQVITIRSAPVEYKLQITKQEFFRFLFCQVRNRVKKKKIGVNFVFFTLFCTWPNRNRRNSCFVICNLYSTRKGLRVVFHHKKKYKKYDISKYEIFFTTQKNCKTSFDEIRRASYFVFGISYFDMSYFSYFFCDGRRP